LDLVHGIQHDHSLDDVLLVLDEVAFPSLPTPDLERARVVFRRRVLRRLRRGVGVFGLGRHYFISSMTAFRWSGMGGIVSRLNSMSPLAPFLTTKLNAPNAGSLSG